MKKLWYIDGIVNWFSFITNLNTVPLLLVSPIWLVSRHAWYWIEKKTYNWSAYSLNLIGSRWGYTVRAYGDIEKIRRIIKDHPDDLGIVIANHQSLIDIWALIVFWTRIVPDENHFQDITWIQDYVLGIVPFFGFRCKLHGDFFVLQGEDINPFTKLFKCVRSSKQLRSKLEGDLRSHVKKIVKRHRFLQFFPEAGLFHKIKGSRRRFAEKHGLPKLEYVAIPKTGGFAFMLDEMHKNNDIGHVKETKRKVKHLIRLTISYPDINKPWTIGNMIENPVSVDDNRSNCYIHVHVEDIENVPRPKIDDPVKLDLMLPPEEAKFARDIRAGAKMKEPFEQYVLQQYVAMDEVQRKYYEARHAVDNKERTEIIPDYVDLTFPRGIMILNYILGYLTLLVWPAAIACAVFFATR